MIEVNCNLCNRNDWKVRFPATTTYLEGPDVRTFRCTSPDYGSHAQIVQCNHCDLVYANPQWSPEELVAAYTAVEDETYVQEREGRELTFEKHLNALEEFTGPADGRSLLDVGAYIGVFVEIARTYGWLAEGIEPSSWAVAKARERNLPIYQGTQQNMVLADRKFDVVTMWDVIEHVTDPISELKRSYQLLKPGGWLAVHTMDIDSLIARVLGNHWPWLMDMHLYYFSQKTLSKMIQKSGFHVEWSGAQGRYLRLGYISSRLAGFNQHLGNISSTIFNRFNLNHMAIPINFGDLFTVYAQKPNEEADK
jgi:2-polyprenyl-3-methyl-5-hydroxy-6-metoxy-1,4-benzoquinol methylase